MTARADVVKGSALVSRTLHSRGLLHGLTSGVVRKVAGKLANDGRYVYVNACGHQVEADLSDYMERIGFFGAHSSKLVRFITEHLSPGDWAIDAGANVGLISSPMAAAVGSLGCVWAIEPLPRNVERLQSLRKDNQLTQLEIFPVALSSEASTARLRLSSLPGGSGSASLVAPWAEPEYVEVRTCTLDELVTASDPRRPLRLLKIDVEGFELELLAGARETLATQRPLVVCEFHDALLKSAGTSADGLVDAFAKHGYVPTAPLGRPPGSIDGRVVDMLLAPRAAANSM